MRSIRRHTPLALAALLHVAVLGAVSLRAQDAVTAPTSLSKALPASATGEQIYRAACATCHGVDGKGAPQQVVGFALPLPNGHGFPDFTDCATNTVEPLADWVAVAQRGGRVRALDRHMPAFGDALSGEQLQQAVKYLWTLLPEPGVAARRPEPAAGVLHREGVPRERDRVDDRRSPPRAPRRSRTSSSTNIASAPAASTK